MPPAEPSPFISAVADLLPSTSQPSRSNSRKEKPTPEENIFGYLYTLPIRELPGVIAEYQAALDACTKGTELHQELRQKVFWAEGTLQTRQAETEDAAIADRFERIRSGQELLIRPGQSQELPADTLRRTIRQAASTTDWTEAQKQGLEPHPFLLALLQHDPAELVDVLREASVAFWVSYFGRYWRNHRRASRDCNDLKLHQPWLGPDQEDFVHTIAAWLDNHPDAPLHPGWASNPEAVIRLLKLNFTNPGYRLTTAEALAKEHEITYVCSRRWSRETEKEPSDFTLASQNAQQFGITLDPLSLPEWVAPAECGLWRSGKWRREGKFGVHFDHVSWGIHHKRTRQLGKLTFLERNSAQRGAVSLLELIAPANYSRKPSRGRPPGSKNKALYRRGPRSNSPDAIARYEDRLKQAELRKTETETKAKVLLEAKEQGTDPRVAIHLAVLAGRLPRQAGGQRKYSEPPPPSTQACKPITRLRKALDLGMGAVETAHLGAKPVYWTPEELDGSVPHPLVRALLDPSIPEEDVVKVCATRELVFRYGRGGLGFGGQWLSSPHFDPDWAAKCAERWWPAEDEIWFAAPGSPGALEEAAHGRVALVGAGAGKGALQQQLETLEVQHKELMRELQDEGHYWDPGKESREELDERLDAIEAEADRVWDEMEEMRGQAETEASLAIGGERERFERLLAPFAWLDPNYCRALRTALEEAQTRKALAGDRRMAPESRLPKEGDG